VGALKLDVSLIGLPGSGKSTVGRQLARKFDTEFIDTDNEIELRLGCSIREYFEREGEDSFRFVEQTTLADLYVRPVPASAARVLATGGGSVLRSANRDLLRSSGYVIYLHSRPDDIFKRLRYDRNRPLLQVGDPLQRLRDLYVARDPLYRETAQSVIETGRPSVATLVNMIATQLELAGVIKSKPSISK
jgi:shikimate kinase